VRWLLHLRPIEPAGCGRVGAVSLHHVAGAVGGVGVDFGSGLAGAKGAVILRVGGMRCGARPSGRLAVGLEGGRA
jgi:hypothetical protein